MTARSAVDDATRRGHLRDVPPQLMGVPVAFPIGKVANYLRLRELAPDLPFIPVLQGDTAASYERCADLYEQAGIDLTALPLVGVGSVCRRQHTAEVEQIMRTLAARGLRLHGFGVKTIGLSRYADALSSSDSAAWSLRGRYVPGCKPSHRTESNCLRFALAWRHRLQVSLDPAQPSHAVHIAAA